MPQALTERTRVILGTLAVRSLIYGTSVSRILLGGSFYSESNDAVFHPMACDEPTMLMPLTMTCLFSVAFPRLLGPLAPSCLRLCACVLQLTYDYKFEREDGTLECLCGAVNCHGSMN